MAPVAVHRQAPRTMPVRPGRPAAAGAASHARSPATGSRRPRLPPALGAGCGPVRTGSYSGRRVRARPAAPSGARGRSARPAPPAASATTRRMSSVQPTAPNPWDSAAAGVPAADVAGGAVGELGRSAEVGVGVAVLVRVGRVGAATAEPKDQDEPGQKPCPTCPTAKDRCSRPPVPVSGRGWDSPRQHPQDIRIDDHLRIGQGRRGNHARQATPAVLWPGSVCGITRSG